MKKWFSICYEVDTGYNFVRDKALIHSESKEEAEKLLREYLSKIDEDYIVSKIFEIAEFNEIIFTGRFGFPEDPDYND